MYHIYIILSLTTYTIRRKLKSELFLNSFNNVTFYYENLKQESVDKAKAKINDKISYRIRPRAPTIFVLVVQAKATALNDTNDFAADDDHDDGFCCFRPLEE